MKTALKQQIATATQKYIDAYSLKQADVAKKAGIGKEYLSYILKGVFTYDAGKDKTGDIADKYFYNLANFIGFATEKLYWDIKPTDQLTQSISILQDGKEQGEIRLLIGVTGAGKTQAVDLFVKKNPADCFAVKVGSSDNLNDLIDKVVDALKITTGKTKSTKIRAIIKHLRDLRLQGYTPQLIFDESEYMKIPVLWMMKEFVDNLKGYCSVVKVGTPQLLENIEALRKRNKNGIPQYWRRIKFGIRVLPALDKSYNLFLSDIEDKQLVQFLRKNCENYGELHDAIVPCRREADRLGEPLTLSLITKVLSLPPKNVI